MKSKKYVEDMNNIHPREDLIKDTIEKIETMNNIKKVNNRISFKKAIAGTAAVVVLAFGSVGAYSLISGNTEILEKIGINVSKNYEKNAQEIKQNDGAHFSYNGLDCSLKSISIDSNTLVMEMDLKLDEQIDCVNPELMLGNIKFNFASREVPMGEYFRKDEKQSIQQQSDGTYKVFKYIALSDPNTMGSNVFEDLFWDEDEKAKVTVSFGTLIGNDGVQIMALDENTCKFEFELNKTEAFKSGQYIENGEHIQYKNVQIIVNGVKQSSFGNVITINATENNIDINKINDIQKIDFVVKDSNGNELKIVSRTQNITVADYKDGEIHSLTLEDIQLVVDDTSETPDYKIEIKESEAAIITTKEIKDLNEEFLNGFRSGYMVLTSDGAMEPRDYLKEGQYYVDDYGVYLTDLTVDEIIEIRDSQPQG